MGQYCDGFQDDYKTTEKIINGYAKKAIGCASCEAKCVINWLIPGATDAVQFAANKAANKVADEGVRMATKALLKRINVVVTVYDTAVTAKCVLSCE